MAGADISLIYGDCTDDSDEGFEQGDCTNGTPQDDVMLPPLLRVQKYAQSANIFDRQMVARVVQDLFRIATPEALTKDLPDVMKVLTKVGDESMMLRADLLEQIPHIAAQAVECSVRVSALKNVVSEYLIPLVVRNLGSSDTGVDKAAHTTLIHLIEHGYITKLQAEIQVCPSILALSKIENHLDVNTGAVTLMSKLAPLLGRDITQRVLLQRFAELCASHMFFVRKVTASHFGDFCAVVGKDAFENTLLPCYIALCNDDIWGVRKACAEVVMFVSCACPAQTRRTVLAPVFGKLLQDECRWVRMSAFQTLGPFISTFADPIVTSFGYNNMGNLVLMNGDGSEFLMNSPCVPENRSTPLQNFFHEKDARFENLTEIDVNNCDWIWGGKGGGDQIADSDNDKETSDQKDENMSENISKDDVKTSDKDNSQSEVVNEDVNISKEEVKSEEFKIEFIKEIVETVKNAVLSYRNEELEKGFIEDKVKKTLMLESVPLKHNSVENCSIDSTNSHLCELPNFKVTDNTASEQNNSNIENSKKLKSEKSNDSNLVSEKQSCNKSANFRVKDDNVQKKDDQHGAVIDENNKVNLACSGDDVSTQEDDLFFYNSYNYWYISPDVVDVTLLAESVCNGSNNSEKTEDRHMTSKLEELYSMIKLSDISEIESMENSKISDNLDTTKADTNSMIQEDGNESNSKNPAEEQALPQDIVPQQLIDHFISMTDPSLALTIDNEMTYHCAYSLPAVALTLGRDNWPLLKHTVDSLAGDMQYKVRRTVASGLHELASILGPEIATENLAPLFDDFLKDLDEVRIGVLKHLAHFLQLISPAKRVLYLPRLQEFLQTDNEWNWRFRQELAKQLLLAVKLFKSTDVAKYISNIAQDLMCDKVAAVRQVALQLVTEILRYISAEPALSPSLLAKLAEKFAHSKRWKRRQTYALLCSELLQAEALLPGQFSSEVMPHFLDLSWDPVANVRLVVARCLSQCIMTNEYFSDPDNEDFHSLETVLRRLQADKDKDVRQSAEM